MADSTHRLHADLVVAGGGLAGVCAAVRAAREGLKVILVQDRSVLGGNASSEIRMHVVGADKHGGRKGWRESGLVEEIRLLDSSRNPERCYPYFDVLLYEFVTAEPNITLLLDTAVVGVRLVGGASPPPPPARSQSLFEYRGLDHCRIESVQAVRHITEDRFELVATFFADCTGDGRLGAEAGADHRIGRESQAMLNEDLAPEVDDPQTLGSSILLTTRRTGTVSTFTPPKWSRKFTPELLNVGRPIHGWEYGFWWIEWGGHLDSLKDHATTIRHELYAIALGIWDHIKNSGLYPNAAEWTLDWIGAVPGKRESRRFLGPHLLTQHDIRSCAKFSDAVAYGGWHIDIHPVRGIDAVDEPPFIPHPVDEVYQIPLRSYFSRNVENLFFAGRNISASHVAFASTRVMATCAVGGEAVGFAAAMCVREGTLPATLATDDRAMSRLQQHMMSCDVTLPYLRIQQGDLLARATLSCSSAGEGFPVELLRDGVTRDHLNPGTGEVIQPHGWRSARLNPAGGEWFELSWPEPVNVEQVCLTFDTGLQRELTLSASDYVTSKMVRGPQPETVADYQILADGEEIVRIEGNVQRFRVHPMVRKLSKLRVRITATQGVPEARVFSIGLA